jgi:hypothetical protein
MMALPILARAAAADAMAATSFGAAKRRSPN